MEDQWSPHSYGYYYYQEEIFQEFEELKHSLLCTTFELESTILSAQEEIAKREYELISLKDLLNKTIKEKAEAEAKCQDLLMENLKLQQKDEESKSDSWKSDYSKNHFLQYDCNEMENQKPLPEKGKLLQAVMEAGPLLQNLILAGELPQWQNPPPKIDSIEIPSIAITSPLMHQEIGKKRGLLISEESDSSPKSKFQKGISQFD